MVIAGAGGFGNEVLGYATDAALAGWPHNVVGFFDDDRAALRSRDTDLQVIDALESADFGSNDVLIAVGDPARAAASGSQWQLPAVGWSR